MATKIYETGWVQLIDGTELYITPIKIKYLREFMVTFENLRNATNEELAMDAMVDCVRVCMQQYAPHIKTNQDVEDNFDMHSLYEVLDFAAGIKLKEESDKNINDQAKEAEGSWETLDLAKLESEMFLLGIWKDFEELEKSLSMPELIIALEAKREKDYNNQKFFAALQGVDLDKQSGKESANAWEKMKAKAFSGGKTNDPNDITALQGYNAQKAGFGIGLGLDYVDMTKK